MRSIVLNLFISGIIFGAGPCMASCGPVLLTYIGGAGKGGRSGLAAYAVFSLARTCVYLVFAAVAFLAGTFALEHALQKWYGPLVVSGGVFIMFLGALTMAGRDCAGPSCRAPGAQRETASVFLLGVLAGVAPCAPLVGVLSYIVFVAKSLREALWFAGAFGLGTSLSPLLVLAGLTGLLRRAGFLKQEAYARVVRICCALLLLALGAQLALRGIRG